ncbi:MAG: outer membrane beta-barrel protein [Planctomycetota bacterium]
MWRNIAMFLATGVTVLSMASWAGAADPASKPAEAAKPAAAETQSAAPVAWPPGFLMDLLGPCLKKPMDDLGLRMYGVVEVGFTGNLIGGDDVLPGRVFEARRVNNFRLHQLRLILERPYDATKAFDFGGKVEGMFGGDAMLTHSPGLFDKAGHGTADAWADMLQLYGQLWFKTGAESGLEITGGKFVTPMGAEVIAAEGNALYSRSYLFGYAIPFTHTGIKLNYIVSPQASMYFALVEGWEVWEDNNHAPSYMVGGALSSKEQVEGRAQDTIYWNVITGPEQADNTRDFRTVIDLTYTHVWSGALSQSINADFGMEPGVPDVGYARWYGLAHYLTYTLNKYASATWRAEWFRDEGGSRTGVDGAWYENTLGLTLTPCPDHPVFKNLSFRPELRWDYCSEEAFGGGDRHNQLTAGVDMVFKF